jgi:hypothetical protein
MTMWPGAAAASSCTQTFMQQATVHARQHPKGHCVRWEPHAKTKTKTKTKNMIMRPNGTKSSTWTKTTIGGLSSVYRLV